ncbi:MAG: hypothetical protein HKO62_14190 [Gammaproteobacteria bacterium]|nr:hypothetical protein [Gammaproteobacteria bacterium]NNM01900.1 hypothetical protein [Gammaproteobacteria bacterium]
MSGQLTLPVCSACGTVQQPPRELCRNCLADAIEPRALPAGGTVLAGTSLAIGTDPELRNDLPVSVATVQLDPPAGGTSVIAFIEPDLAQAGTRVTLHNAIDRRGEAVFVALRPGGALPEPLRPWAELLPG